MYLKCPNIYGIHMHVYPYMRQYIEHKSLGHTRSRDHRIARLVTNLGDVKPRSHEGLGPCCDLCKTSHVVKSQVDLIRARDRS